MGETNKNLGRSLYFPWRVESKVRLTYRVHQESSKGDGGLVLFRRAWGNHFVSQGIQDVLETIYTIFQETLGQTG